MATAVDTGKIYDVSNFKPIGVVKAMVAYCRAHPDQPVIASVDRMLAGLPYVESQF
ncbi:hypothetical protein PSQ19_14985 [Devosia algicola]|uniref:Uncharacterized protein n=1 Tax=Devosia algicola TaxID=3026418 RepID=A0ABY7YLD3_9HYPH|nr:hypothetical protein [Devosia algicola]WDR01978.1 hypothetical protein PSQ19_14985 [Devosia algicola]